MAPYHGGARYVERSKRGVVRSVREVDEDAETVELPHEGLAEWAVFAKRRLVESEAVRRAHLSPWCSGSMPSKSPHESANTL